jgi:hypothetical protein
VERPYYIAARLLPNRESTVTCHGDCRHAFDGGLAATDSRGRRWDARAAADCTCCENSEKGVGNAGPQRRCGPADLPYRLLQQEDEGGRPPGNRRVRIDAAAAVVRGFDVVLAVVGQESHPGRRA